MTQSEYQTVVEQKAQVAEDLSNQIEDLFEGSFLQARMIENDIYRREVLEAQHQAVQALRTLRRTLEKNSVALAYQETPEGKKAIKEYAKR
jgi:hypothetical protein